eukprot:1157701-Pelagomonas_calceolata.AAC.5
MLSFGLLPYTLTRMHACVRERARACLCSAGWHKGQKEEKEACIGVKQFDAHAVHLLLWQRVRQSGCLSQVGRKGTTP